jgi:hypothetical protein
VLSRCLSLVEGEWNTKDGVMVSGSYTYTIPIVDTEASSARVSLLVPFRSHE